MATIQRYVNTASTAGGDGTTNDTAGATRAYASLNEWETAMGAGNAADDYIVDCCGTAADTTATTVNFSANSIIIRANTSDGAGKYNGNEVISTSHYRLRVNGANPLVCASKNVTVDGIQVQIHTNGTSRTGIDTSGCFNNTVVKNCRIHADGVITELGLGTQGSTTGSPGGNTWTFENNLIVNFKKGIRHAGVNFWSQTVTIRHNTIRGDASANSGIIIADTASADTDYFVYGNAISNTGATLSIASTLGSASTLTTADNACSVASSTTDEIALSSEAAAYTAHGSTAAADFRPLNTGPLYQAVNPTRVTTDIVGFTRDGASHDIGAFEVQGAPAPAISTPTNTLTGTTRTTAGASLDSNISSGTLYALGRTGGSAAGAAAIKASGQSAAVSGTGAKTVAGVVVAAGSATQHVDLVYNDTTNGDSNVVTFGPFTTASALSFSGTIPTQTVTSGNAVDIDLSTYWTGTGFGSLAYSGIGASLAGTGLSLNTSTGHITGTAGSEQTVAGVQVRKADSGSVVSQADSNTFTLQIDPAPTATSPTGTATGTTTATGTVTTNKSGGTLYFLFSANATESPASPPVGWISQVVSASGVQNVSVTGLIAGTAYYPHYVYRDAGGNQTAVATGAQFNTWAAALQFAVGASMGSWSGTLEGYNATPGTFTTHPLANDVTGSVLANTAGITVAVYNATTGALIARVTGLTTDVSGVATFSDGALVPGTTYKYDVDTPQGARMKTKAAT